MMATFNCCCFTQQATGRNEIKELSFDISLHDGLDDVRLSYQFSIKGKFTPFGTVVFTLTAMKDG